MNHDSLEAYLGLDGPRVRNSKSTSSQMHLEASLGPGGTLHPSMPATGAALEDQGDDDWISRVLVLCKVKNVVL